LNMATMVMKSEILGEMDSKNTGRRSDAGVLSFTESNTGACSEEAAEWCNSGKRAASIAKK
jgi:hypothetical protein